VSFVVAAPEAVQAAAQGLAGIRSTLSEASAAAAGPTTGVVAAAEDQVSAAVAAIFGEFGQEYQVLNAQAQEFHQQFVNLMNAGAGAYLSAEAANAEQALTNAVYAPVQALLGQSSIGAGTAAAVGAATTPAAIGDTVNAVVGPYESLITNTAANLQSLGNTSINVTGPALMQAVTAPITNSQLIVTALENGNLLPILTLTGQTGLGYTNLMRALTAPISLSLTSLNSSGASFALGIGVPELLAFDALGAQVNAAAAAAASNAAIFNAIQAGNPVAAAVALIDAPANIANGLLNGQETLSLNLPLPGLSVTAEVPFTGLLVPLQPITATATGPTLPLLNTVTVTGPPAGGLIPALVNYVPGLLATAL